jgi:osmotically inducible protein OsmC
MSVAAILTKKGLNPTSLDTKATVTLEGLNITAIHLSITGAVAGITAEEFSAVTKDAEKKCLISKILNIPVTSEAHFVP